MDNEIKEFYKEKNVLITGGTGFFGKLIIQKLLRSCHSTNIYLIVRPKKNTNPHDRIKSLFNDMLFDTLKEEHPEFQGKINVVEGDMSCDNLKLSTDSQNLLIEKIHIVFHCAASLNMSSKLKDAVNNNVKSTNELMKLCRQMKNLQSIVMVSTAFSNCQNTIIDEKFYKCDVEPELLIKMCDELDEDIVESIKPRLLGQFINTYCFTKALSETLVANVGGDLPLGVFRPSIVTSTYSDPVSGWTDNVYGALGVMLAVILGIMRVANFRIDTRADIVPADFCVNALICTAWEIYQNRQRNQGSVPVYNFTNSSNSITWADFKRLFLTHYRYACSKMVWSPFLITCDSKLTYTLLHFLLHLVPGHLCDCCLVMTGQKPRFSKIYRNLSRFHDVIRHFNRHEWCIKSENTQTLWKKLSEDAKREYCFDVNTINYDLYFKMMPYGLKKFFLKEDMSNCERDRKVLQRFRLVHKITKYCFWMLVAVICTAMYLRYCR